MSCLNNPAGTVFCETGCLKSSGIGARLGFDVGGNGSSFAPSADRTGSGGWFSWSSAGDGDEANGYGREVDICIGGANGIEPGKPENVKGFAEALSEFSLT